LKVAIRPEAAGQPQPRGERPEGGGATKLGWANKSPEQRERGGKLDVIVLDVLKEFPANRMELCWPAESGGSNEQRKPAGHTMYGPGCPKATK
jgi:hypothetical protein